MTHAFFLQRTPRKTFLRYRRTIRQQLPPTPDADENLIALLLNPKSAFASQTRLLDPILVLDKDRNPLASAIWIIAAQMPDTLQIAFLDLASNAQTALDFLIEQTRVEAQLNGVKRIVIGLNGHVNNGLGFATEDIQSPCFGSPSNPAFYADWIRPHATRIHKLVSYSHPVKSFSFGKHARLLPSLFKRYQFRSANFRNLRNEIACYTDLNNACFKDHPFYYSRSRDEDYELFRAFRPFLKPDNFIVAMDQNQPVGFLLWYPDLHELVSCNEPLGLRALWRYRVCKHAFSRCKIAEIGVLPSHQRKGVALGMMAECFRRISGHFSICDTGWILEENEDSKALNIRWTDAPHHTYEAYEIDLQGKAS